MIYSNLNKQIEELKSKYIKEKTSKELIENDIQKLTLESENLKELIIRCDKGVIILNQISKDAKKSVIEFLQKLVTDALQYITSSNYTFEIEIEEKEKTVKCEFYVVEEINGVKSRQNPKDSCGGGFVDIISTTLRYAYLSLYNAPKIQGPVLLDEPGKMVSSDMSIKFGEFIKHVGKEFDMQTILITHNDNISNIADNTEYIIKN